jgi:hypothetical protein
MFWDAVRCALIGCRSPSMGRALVGHRTDFLAYPAHLHLGRGIVVLARVAGWSGCVGRVPRRTRRRRVGRGTDAGRIAAAPGGALHLSGLELLRAIGVEEDVRGQSELEFVPERAIVSMDSLAGRTLADIIPINPLSPDPPSALRRKRPEQS